MSSQSIQKQGANARAMGHSKFDNPYFKYENMPVATGESRDDWNAKQFAWELGWTMEDAMRNRR